MAVPGCIPGSEFLLGGFQLRRKWISKLQREKRNKNKITKIPPKKTKTAGARKIPARARMAKQRDAEGGELTPHSEVHSLNSGADHLVKGKTLLPTRPGAFIPAALGRAGEF